VAFAGHPSSARAVAGSAIASAAQGISKTRIIALPESIVG
jgi:hypothetical protein